MIIMLSGSLPELPLPMVLPMRQGPTIFGSLASCSLVLSGVLRLLEASVLPAPEAGTRDDGAPFVGFRCLGGEATVEAIRELLFLSG